MDTVFSRNKDFFSSFISLSSLLILQNIAAFSVNVTDNLMLGAYSQNALSGAATVNQISFFAQQLSVGVGDGLVMLASQYWGRKDLQPIKRALTSALWFGIPISAIIVVLVLFAPHAVLSLFTNDEAILSEGVKYLRILSFTYIIFTITNVLFAGMRSVEKVKVPFYISLSTLVTNATLNFTLIFGYFGAPRLGIEGAAIGTLTARIIELTITISYVFFCDRRLQMKFRDLLKIDPLMFKDYVRVSSPVAATYGLWGLATGIQTAILGHLDADAIAANSISTTFFQVLKTIFIGASSSTGVLIGKTIGSGQIALAKHYTRILQFIYIGMGVAVSLILLAIREPLLQFYALDANAKQLAAQFMLILCVTGIGTAYEMPTLSGIIRGGGDARFVLINDIISIWGIVLPSSFLAAFVWHLPAVVVVLFLNADQLFKCPIAAIKVNRFHWIKILAREPVADARHQAEPASI